LCRPPNRPGGAAAIAFGVAGVLSGCHQFGPGTIERARVSYNEVINRTSNEQLLLNLVRLKYRDTPFFLEISSLTSSFQFGASVGSDGSPNQAPYFDPITVQVLEGR
jgi:hypothetical protein